MTYSIHQIPFFEELKDSQNILLAGAGGGFDIYSGIPLYLNLRSQGKNVILENLSFTRLSYTSSECVFPHCYKIKAKDKDLSGIDYFPEKYLALWMASEGIIPDLYAFEKTGVNPLKDTYKFLIKTYKIDTVILVDGGTDSLMFGDEEGLGTPHEDICSMAAVYRTGIKKQFLVSVGFGVDHFHKVSHYRFLENVAEIDREGGYLGLFQMLQSMPEVQKYVEAVDFANKNMRGSQSIVSNSIVSAVEGHYGNFHRTYRTEGSELWINPLMTIFWCFELRSIMKKIRYYDFIRDSNTMEELNHGLVQYRREMVEYRPNKQIPI